MTKQQLIFVTGGTGFIGSVLLARLSKSVNILAATRSANAVFPDGVTPVKIAADGDLFASSVPLVGVSVVIHSAARVHIMNDTAVDALAEFRKVNLVGTLNLARQAAAAGVKRFIFISSIKVNGEETLPGKPYSADDTPSPVDAYGISKMEAEQGLRKLGQETGMEIVIIRPVLVYGPGVKANFFNMMKWLSKKIPLPLGAIRNKRSLVAVDNLVDLIVTCIDHSGAANQTFLVSDNEDLSTTQLLERMASALGKPSFLLPLPAFFIKTAATLLGKRAVAQRLCGSLQVDIRKTQQCLDWTPPCKVDEALLKTAQYFQEHQGL